jgi:hypothetical protein
MNRPQHLAAYLNLQSNNAAKCCESLVACGISNVVLQTSKKNSLNNGPESAYKIRELLLSFNLKPVAITATNGLNPLNVAFTASHYGVRDLIYDLRDGQDLNFVKSLAEHCQEYSMHLLVESSTIKNHRILDIARKCESYGAKWLYDPTHAWLHRTHLDITSVQSCIGAINLHDYDESLGFITPGMGDCDLRGLIKKFGDSVWYFIEPIPGRKYGYGSTTQQDEYVTFVQSAMALWS